MKKEIRSNSAPSPIGPYSQAIDAGAVYCAGQIGVNPASGELEGGIEAQTARCLSNLEGVLEAAGLGMKDVVKTTVFLIDLSDYKQMNDEYGKHFMAPFPARSTVQATALPRGARVEIDAIATR